MLYGFVHGHWFIVHRAAVSGPDGANALRFGPHRYVAILRSYRQHRTSAGEEAHVRRRANSGTLLREADMYNHFFGLREHPFSINPDPRYLFLTPQTQRALDQLTYGILSRQGLILLTGEVGTGKTTVINRVRDWLHERQIPTAFIFNSHLDTGQLFDCILAGFGVPPTPQLSGDAYQRLNQWLCVRYRAGELPVLIVDEAQGLTMHVLEEIRMLLNSET